MMGRASLMAGLLLAAGAAPAVAQTLGQGGNTDIPWLRLTAALVLCLGLAIGGAIALNRRLNGGAALGRLSLTGILGRLTPPGSSSLRLTDIETRRLSAQVTVTVFKCDGRDFMVTASALGQIVLVSLDPETPEPDA